MPAGWDNKVKSLKVFRSASFTVTGRWVNRYSVNDKLSFSLSVGTTISNSNERERTITNSFSTSITTGFAFASVTVTHEYSDALRTLTNQSIEKTKTETLNVECGNPE